MHGIHAGWWGPSAQPVSFSSPEALRGYLTDGLDTLSMGRGPKLSEVDHCLNQSCGQGIRRVGQPLIALKRVRANY